MRRSKQAGSVFIIALAVMSGLVAVIAVATVSQQVAFRAQSHRTELSRARIAAEAGIQRALAALQDQPASPTLQTDDWYTLGTNGDEDFTLGSSSFRVQIVDCASLVNLNTATQEQLELLPLTNEQVDCFLDWREATQAPRSDGAKDEYYNQLTYGYNARLGPMLSVDELLLVKNFTPETLYSVQTDVVNTARPMQTTLNGQTQELTLDQMVTVDSTSQAVTSTGGAKLNVNSANAQTLIQRVGLDQNTANNIVNGRPAAGYTNMGQVLAAPGVTVQNARDILNNLTAGGANQIGKINLNTATEAVLGTVPNLPPDAISAIITRQSSGFVELGDLLDVPGMNNLSVLQQTAGFFEVNSQTFLVRALGKAGQSTYALQATVALQNNVFKVIRIEQPPYPDIVNKWGWQPDTTSTTTMKEAGQ